ncbi:MAG: AAA family ATPase, partial [Desulfovibrio sp.]|nr:AAA family ATPase [Desulfovibrio sp.]
MILELPDFCLVLLMGASGSGKSRLAAKIFAPDEVLSADNFRKMIGGDETNQSVTEDAFDCLYRVAQKRADRRKLTVIDATNLNKWARKQALEFAKANNCFACLVALGTPEAECLANNAARPEKNFAAKVIKRQCREFPEALKAAKKENFRRVYVLSPADAAAAEIVRRPLWTDKSSLRGPFDIIGDIHGCYDELCQLLRSLGYEVDEAGFAASHPEGRTAVFLGDLCDRGPNSMAVYRLVMNMTAAGRALCVPGNHDDKFSRYLEGKNIRIGHGLELTIAELEKEDAAFKKDLKDFLRSLVSHYLLDDGALVVCHA